MRLLFFLLFLGGLRAIGRSEGGRSRSGRGAGGSGEEWERAAVRLRFLGGT